MIYNCQRGVSLIITFLIMTVMFAMVLGLVTILFTEIKVAANIGNSVSAFYSADSGIEKTFYLERSSVPIGSPLGDGFCSICSTCQNPANDCSSCTLTPLAANGCSGPPAGTCANCKITYSSAFDGRNFDIQAAKTTDASGNVTFIYYSTGFYNGIRRNISFDSSK